MITATRQSMLHEWVNKFELFGLPDPLERIDQILLESIHGSRSIIHGDLNLENILVGPGNLLWLIDFAQTREGHCLFDFSHLTAEFITHIIAEKIEAPQDFLSVLESNALPPFEDLQLILHALQQISAQLLFNPSNPSEYQISRALACLGALKYRNISNHSRHFLYLAAAYYLNQN